MNIGIAIREYPSTFSKSIEETSMGEIWVKVTRVRKVEAPNATAIGVPISNSRAKSPKSTATLIASLPFCVQPL